MPKASIYSMAVGRADNSAKKRGSVSNEPVVEIEGRQLKLSNLDKVLYPATGFTKGQVIDYYARIAPVLVPHLDRTAADAQALSQRGRQPILF